MQLNIHSTKQLTSSTTPCFFKMVFLLRDLSGFLFWRVIKELKNKKNWLRESGFEPSYFSWTSIMIKTRYKQTKITYVCNFFSLIPFGQLKGRNSSAGGIFVKIAFDSFKKFFQDCEQKQFSKNKLHKEYISNPTNNKENVLTTPQCFRSVWLSGRKTNWGKTLETRLQVSKNYNVLFSLFTLGLCLQLWHSGRTVFHFFSSSASLLVLF